MAVHRKTPILLAVGAVVALQTAQAQEPDAVSGELSIELAQQYDNNILAEDLDISSKESDFITVVTPRFSLNVGDGDFRFSLEGAAELREYWQNGSESAEGFDATVGGEFDVSETSRVSGRAEFSRGHEDRRSAEDVAGDKLARIDEFAVHAGAEIDLGDVSVGLDGLWRTRNFSDVMLGPVELNNDDRDRKRWEASATVRYSITEESVVYAIARYLNVSYDDALDDFGLNRDSDGYDLRAGFAIQPGDGLTLDIHGGYHDQRYDDPLLPDVNSIVYGLEFSAVITETLDFRASVARDSFETSFAEIEGVGSGYFGTAAVAAFEWQILPGEFSFGVEGGLTRNDWTGNDRNDDISFARGTIHVGIWRDLYLEGGYQFEHRASNSPNDDYTKNIIFLRLGADG